jgi:hypothetical protein
MLLTRGIFPQIQGARSGSCEAYHGISNTLPHGWSVRDCSASSSPGLNPGGEQEGFRCRLHGARASIQVCFKEGLFSGRTG